MAAIMTRTTMAAPPMPRTKGGMVRPSGLSVSEPEEKTFFSKCFVSGQTKGRPKNFLLKNSIFF
jgi:hypothetical protein